MCSLVIQIYNLATKEKKALSFLPYFGSLKNKMSISYEGNLDISCL